MKRLPLLVFALACAGCHYEEQLADPRYFAQPADKDSRSTSGHKTVWDDKNNQVGYVEIQRSQVKGSKQYHEDYFVKDLSYNMIGFISEKGSTYRFKQGSAEFIHVGNYTLQDGIRVLLEIRRPFELRSTRVED